ncbi:hypothetical protein SJAG_04674 [Schizosaccharomyces japonicus yFS275]|uniref:D-lactate dehydratase n=1 Tax=Schizosaccharomyces japonicus (strain yFS275 / FY16936) TaxID=402676 RepID=B6K7G4_SCHJY|nr:hypothetical protein SJAG_04674 [Schizosaccharomyces japonicus yFS275]EEB09468.2 hypothetical protein SJAG_04674 [Schizosaccharomyces japonicus yFS275]
MDRSSTPMPLALIIVTSYCGPFYDDGKKTGAYFSEILHPYEAFTRNCFQVEFASETGHVGFDEHSIVPPAVTGEELRVLHDNSHPLMRALHSAVQRVDSLDINRYDIVFVAGGHGTLFDMPRSGDIQKFLAGMYEAGKIVAAVCHGPVVLPFVHLKGGTPLVEGKRITGFTRKGEEMVGVMGTMQKHNFKTIEDLAESAGAVFKQKEDPFEEYVVLDGHLVTGTNPASARRTAEVAVEAWKRVETHACVY